MDTLWIHFARKLRKKEKQIFIAKIVTVNALLNTITQDTCQPINTNGYIREKCPSK
jgi:hypothetical protein